jgi:hypothetical protein
MDRFPAAIRSMARHQTQQVAGARITDVVHALGPAYRHPAAQAFTHGYHVAVGCGACCLVAAAAIAILGLRQRAGFDLAGATTPVTRGAGRAR